MPPKDDKKKKDAAKSAKKDKDPVNKSGDKAKKKKWSKGKVRDKLNNLVLFDKATYDKLCKEVPNKLITSAVVSERLKIRGSLARAALQELLSKGLIKLVSKHRAQVIYTRNTKGGDAPAAGKDSWTWGSYTKYTSPSQGSLVLIWFFFFLFLNSSHQLYILKNKTLLNQNKIK